MTHQLDIARLLNDACGPDVVTPGPEVPERYRHDWAGLEPIEPAALVQPRRTEEVSAALRVCQANGIPVVPQGGLTGISGAAHPIADGIVLSLERMNKILSVDPLEATLTAEAGTVLETAQEAADEAGLMLAIDIGARGSCQLGGLVATNAGGHNVIRYGMTRDQLLGLEVVLADGTIVDDFNTLTKNNAGLDLKHLFVGTEGLFGIITRCTMRLHPGQTEKQTALIGCPDTDALLDLLARAKKSLGPMLTCFEVMWPSFYETMAERCGIRTAIEGKHGVYAILEATGGAGSMAREKMESLLENAFEAGCVADAVLANSVKEEHELWAVRETPAEYGAVIGQIVPFDVGVPTRQIPEAVRLFETRLKERWPDIIALSYGHIGDNNLHLVVHVPGQEAQPEQHVKELVYGTVRELGGTISAEHGIGLIKRDYMSYSRSPSQIRTMQLLKSALDPKGILNPGKGFDQIKTASA
ncbi:FAD-binding oxidoreductase [Roseicyclus sp. F158]|uniref:FAD-binding oxidoreductase n=1 Tax=Tropicimonas omnivorans TaxID=3075590 RepID=A0ABU3DEB4_9RHOB|nr:FAD-binding oxidoreductase [Roseicyclus sp. F158]MDT0682022.1 FAD-binding oxidoreductase [Roseicyclus sp. F158]